MQGKCDGRKVSPTHLGLILKNAYFLSFYHSNLSLRGFLDLLLYGNNLSTQMGQSSWASMVHRITEAQLALRYSWEDPYPWTEEPRSKDIWLVSIKAFPFFFFFFNHFGCPGGLEVPLCFVACLSDVTEVIEGRAKDPGKGIKQSHRVVRGPLYFDCLSVRHKNSCSG